MINTDLSTQAREKMISTYRRLHQNPELSMQEYKTQEFIEKELDDIGLEHFRCGGTGVVAIDKMEKARQWLFARTPTVCRLRSKRAWSMHRQALAN